MKRGEGSDVDHAALQAFVDDRWDSSVLPVLEEYIRIPNKSPAFDPDWQEHGHMERAVDADRDLVQGARDHRVAGRGRAPAGRTPLLFMEIPGTSERRRTVCSTATSTSSRR